MTRNMRQYANRHAFITMGSVDPQHARSVMRPDDAVYEVPDEHDLVRVLPPPTRPHVVVCALTSLACMQVPMRPGDVKREPADLPLFGECG